MRTNLSVTDTQSTRTQQTRTTETDRGDLPETSLAPSPKRKRKRGRETRAARLCFQLPPRRRCRRRRRRRGLFVEGLPWRLAGWLRLWRSERASEQKGRKDAFSHSSSPGAGSRGRQRSRLARLGDRRSRTRAATSHLQPRGPGALRPKVTAPGDLPPTPPPLPPARPPQNGATSSWAPRVRWLPGSIWRWALLVFFLLL